VLQFLASKFQFKFLLYQLFGRFLSSSLGCTAKVMLCSDDDWVINITLICSRASKENNLPLKPDLPTMPLPSKLRMLILLIDEIPLIGKVDALQS
jgi:hypothetical protein